MYIIPYFEAVLCILRFILRQRFTSEIIELGKTAVAVAAVWGFNRDLLGVVGRGYK